MEMACWQNCVGRNDDDGTGMLEVRSVGWIGCRRMVGIIMIWNVMKINMRVIPTTDIAASEMKSSFIGSMFFVR